MLPSAFILVSMLLAVPPGLVPPTPPAAFRGPEVAAAPLDRALSRGAKLRRDAPLAVWCPTGPDFVQWTKERDLAARGTPPATAAGPRAKSHGGTPEVRLDRGVVVMEDDGTLTRFDRRPDLAGQSALFIPGPLGWTMSVVPMTYDANVGAPLWSGERGWFEQAVPLTTLAFPFGGASQTQLFVTSTMAVTFADPSPPSPAQLHLEDAIFDRLPRIAPVQQGTSLLGWNAFFREDANRAVITWRAAEGAWLDLDVQVVLYADGSILMTWARLQGLQHGSVIVVDGDPTWWADRATMGETLDPVDVTVPAPDGPALDVVAVRAFQVADSELIELEVEYSAPLPPMTDGTLQFAIEVEDDAGSGSFRTLWGEWEDGRWNWTYQPIEVDGNILRYRLLRTELPLTDDDLSVVAWSAQSWNWVQAVRANLTLPRLPVQPLMRDVSAGALVDVRGPIVESFTLPELLVGAVHDAFNRHYDSPRIDGLAIYPNFDTDIVFYAGAYSTVGNAGADGIGSGGTMDPEAPAVLHMSTLRGSWNGWDEGKILVLNHEFGHHWLYFFQIMENGTPTSILGSGHPAGWVHTPAAFPILDPLDSSCMGGTTWRDNADGTFTSPPNLVNHAYSWHELYLMGLAEPAEVQDWWYLRDSMPALPGAYWPAANLTVTATRVGVTVSQIIDAMGPRVPDASASRRDLTVPMVLIIRPGEIGPDDVPEVERTCDLWAGAFHDATLQRATVTCDRVGDRPPEATILDPQLDVTVLAWDTVSFTGEGTDADEDAVDLTWDFDGVAPGLPGQGPHAVTFATVGTYTVTLSARDATGREDATPDVRTVVVNCRIPEELAGLRVSHGGGLLGFTWTPQVPPPDEHAVFAGALAGGGFAEVTAGGLGVTVPTPPETLVFYRVAARNLPDCLGP